MQRKNGFTIMELMTVIAIIAITSAITIPNIISWRSNAQLSEGAREILSGLRSARMRAIKENRTVRVTFTDGNGGGYTVTADGDGDGVADPNNANDEKDLASGSIPGNVDMYEVKLPGDGDSFVEFDSKGLAVNTSGHIYLTNGKKYQSLTVSITGNIKADYSSSAF